jgi:hemerythrin superfamily protein
VGAAVFRSRLSHGTKQKQVARCVLTVRCMKPHLTAPRSAGPEDLRQILSRDHERLDRLFRDLLSAFEADARIEEGRLWNEFDTDLRAHMQLEEEQLLPKFAEVNASEAAALRREHDVLRSKLLQLGVGVDLHCTRHSQVEDFVRELRAHAKREDELMYGWVQSHVNDPEVRRGIVQRLAAKLRPQPA